MPVEFPRRRMTALMILLEYLLDLVKHRGLLLVDVLFIACASSTNVMGLFPRNSSRCLGDDLRVVWCASCCYSILVDVSGTSTSC
jgi:hypothetical protein